MAVCFICISRLDAGTYGTMGVGVGFALAAALWCRDHAPEKRVVCIEGDSAFGFSGMEVETIMRLVSYGYVTQHTAIPFTPAYYIVCLRNSVYVVVLIVHCSHFAQIQPSCFVHCDKQQWDCNGY